MYIESSFRYKQIQDIINITLQDYYSFVYNPTNNPLIENLSKRDLLFKIERHGVANGKYPIINAFSIYKATKDVIIITEKLVEMIESIIFNSEPDNNRAACMIDTAISYCAFHEMGHLLLGHCQIQKDMRMCAIENTNENTDIAIYQMLEADADTFAAKRLGEKMVTLIFDDRYKSILGYKSIDIFYEDILKGINAFFYILMYLELLEAKESYMLTSNGEIPKGRRHNEATHDHPPAIARCYYTGKTLIEHLYYQFQIPPKEKYFMEILYSSDYLFGGIELTSMQKEKKFNHITDGSFDETFNAMRQEWLLNTCKILSQYSRIPVF
ncbi:hypothetical protein [Culturomica massiliensis]|uniref:hypothetical protein n=1 Tax=Culturomica massiliensis TaxID=1841857 RepID=UPI000335D336|nr:hypothetical protein [Culturomica massiliensis]CCZ07358.1 unknown [Odoribacter sp. CAG:788]